MKKYLLTIWSQNPEYYFLIQSKINYLLKKKYKVILVSQANSKYDVKKFNIKNYIEKKITYSKISYINKIYFFYYIFYLIFLTFLKKPNVIIVYNNYPIIFIKIISFFFKGKFIYHNFDYNLKPDTIFSSLINYIEKKSFEIFDLIIFSNEERANFLIKKFNLKRSKVITLYNVLNIKFQKYLTDLRNKSDDKIIKLFRIGSIGPGHGLISLLKSFKYLPKNYHLILCGKIVNDKYFNNIKKIIIRNKISHQIQIINSPKRKKWESLLSNSDIGVALYENVNFSHKFMVGASQKLNCYIAAGLPVIAFNDKQFLRFHKKHKCCLLINRKNPKNMANTIIRISKNKKMFKNLKKNSILTFQKYYNFENEIKKIKKYL